jgi:hypothetical protein
MNKIKLTFAFILLTVAYSYGQVAFNPEIGLTISTLNNLEKNTSNKARVGWQAGADFRIGRQLYLQPGIFASQTSTVYVIDDGTAQESKLERTDVKLKVLAGFNLLNADDAKLRVNVGPTYNFLIASKAKNDNLDDVTLGQIEDNFNNGLFNIDAGLGIDFWKLTIEGGYSLGLSNAFKDDVDAQAEYVKSNVKYGTFYFNVGFVIGDTKK